MVPVYSELFQKYRHRKEPASDERCIALADAFFKLHVDKRDITGTLQRRILEYSEDFDPAIHFAPYTSLIGPTGVGKSYAVQLLAALLAPSGWKGGGDIIIPLDMHQDKMSYIFVGVITGKMMS